MMGNPLIGGDNMAIMVMDDADAPVNAPNSDLTKDFTNITQSASGVAGNVDVTIELAFENTGNTPLTVRQLIWILESILDSTV